MITGLFYLQVSNRILSSNLWLYNIDYNFPCFTSGSKLFVSVFQIIQGEFSGINKYFELVCFCQFGCLRQYLSVMRSAFPGQQGQQREYTGIAGSAKRKR